jgi:hypothetical protein
MKMNPTHLHITSIFKHRITFLFHLCLLANLLKAQDGSMPVRDRWSYGTAYLMPKHKWESGIAQPFRYGLNEKFELYSNALEFIVFPNIGIKVAQGSRNGFIFASEHVVSYPTIFMNTVSTKGTGGLISPQYYIPSITSFTNSLMATKPIGSASLLSAFVGYAFAVRSSKPDPAATIDLPLVYPRMAHYYEGSTIRLGMSYKSTLSKNFLYEEGFETFFVIRPENNFFFENTGALMWLAGRSLRIKGGYSLSYGRYPYGTMWQLWPALDFVFGSKL